MKKLILLILLIALGVIQPSQAATVALATAPLNTTTTATVLPNLMFILDNSGSMGANYLPDKAGSYSGDVTIYNNPKFNGVMYDTNIRYVTPTNFNPDGTVSTTTYLSQVGTSLATGADTASSIPNWKKVLVDAYKVQSTSTIDTLNSTSVGAAYGKIFGFIPGEICTAIDLKTCVLGTATTASYPYAASLRWCSDTASATQAAAPATGKCRASYTSTYKYARYPSVRTATITVSSSSSSTSVSSIKVNGVEILSAATTASTSYTAVALDIANKINACNGTATGNCAAAGYGATVSGGTVTVYANAQTTLATPVITKSGSMPISASTFATKTNATTGGSNSAPGYNLIRIIPTVGTTAIYPAIGSTSKGGGRSDCAGTLCTANEELTNFANWYTFYHTRMQMMKTGTSNAFKSIGSNFRVGFNRIDDNSSGSYNTGIVSPVATFDATGKYNWYQLLFASLPTGGTPLRMAISQAGKYFANKLGSVADPMQYSCQQNFTILSTDGYWNESNSYVQKIDGSAMTDQDGSGTAKPKYEGSTASANSLADATKYYYDTDLRTSALGNCTGNGGADVCTDNVFTSSTDTNTKQHMTTFTLGLGSDGQLIYQSDYLTATTGDYAGIVAGTVNWPVPVSNTETTTDDLWHAAVNGNGQYFSAGSPQALSDGLNTALSSISAKVGAGAAAATSNLNPVAGDNYAYVASYTSADWWGNLEQRNINTTTGVVSETANWCVEDVTADVCSSPSVVVTDTSSGSTQKSCVTSGSTAAACVSPGVFDSSTSTCSVPMAVACNGTLSSKVSANSDTRTIKMVSAGTLVDFTPANLNLAYFNASLLSQYTSLSAAQQANATASNMVNYLRGQTGYDMSGANAVNNQVFRQRKATLGDAVESTPTYIKKPVYSYADAGYSAFITAQSSRAGAVYLGTNDGMLHSFDSATGNENWAFVPTPVIPNMYKLADKNYANLHNYYVNGDITIGDICTANCTSSSATWKTILVGGLHGGGKGYYALDITNPTSPGLLWEYTSTTNANLGYSFGKPIITKKADGTWVVLMTTGYNNVGDGVGRLLVLNAATGATISSISTGVGSTTTPSGLAQINDFVSALSTNNTAGYVYGGDLLGNLWRFDINAGTSMLFAQLLDPSGTAQPITVAPELGLVNNTRVLFVGTGKYLEGSDLSNTQVQTLYAITDPEATSTLVNPRTVLTQQTFTTVSGTSYRTVSNNTVPASSRGWYINLPDVGERQNVGSQLVSGTLIAPTNVPTNTACSPGGYGYINYVNYQTGGAVLYNNPSYYASIKTNAMVVGLNVMYLGTSYTPVVNVVTADNPTPTLVDVKFATSSAGYQKKRIIWRELIQ
ncbi:MAG: hypothetical protein HOP20_09290 [Sulfuriferula sp.]|nr:hypothetical protein [Sulfuriferula sp.]